MRHLLSTKVLSKEQVEQLESAGWMVVQYDAISIEMQQTPIEPGDQTLIFTSKNAVKAFLRSFPKEDFSGIRCLCVGSRAGGMLRERGCTVLEEAPTAEYLAGLIQKGYAKDSFIYYCGDRRLDRIPDALDRLGVQWKEAINYKTILNQKAFNREFEAVLFFSPSGVESFTRNNNIQGAMGYCIGETTAEALRKHTNRIIIAKTPTIEGLIAEVVAETNLLNH